MSTPLAAGESVFADISEPMLSKPMSSRAKEGTNNNSMGKRNGRGRSNTHPADGLKHINLRGASGGPTGARSAMNFPTIARVAGPNHYCAGPMVRCGLSRGSSLWP
jgi:hypothetical protein